MTMFKQPLFIKPLGVVIDPALLGQTILLKYRRQTQYALMRDSLATNLTPMLTRKTVLTAFATVVINNQALANVGKTAAEINDALEAELEAQIEKEMAPPEPVEPVKKRRGRPAKVVEPEEEEAEAESEDEKFDRLFDQNAAYLNKAYDFDIQQLVIEEETPIPLGSSEPAKFVAAKSSKNLEIIRTKLGQIRKLVEEHARRTALISNHLSTPEIDPALLADYGASSNDDLEDTQIRGVDETALQRHRQKMRTDIEIVEQQIIDAYDWIDQRIITKFHAESEAHTFLFDAEQVSHATASMDRQSVLSDLFTEVVVPIHTVSAE